MSFTFWAGLRRSQNTADVAGEILGATGAEYGTTCKYPNVLQKVVPSSANQKCLLGPPGWCTARLASVSLWGLGKEQKRPSKGKLNTLKWLPGFIRGTIELCFFVHRVLIKSMGDF